MSKKTLNNIFIIIAAMSLSFAGCATTTTALSGTAAGTGSYDGRESGRHWIRPQELTYEIGEPLQYNTTINLRETGLQETVVFGYPQPGRRANPYVSKALAEAVAHHGIDGFFLTTYSIERTTDQATINTAEVTVVGRPLKLVSLGEVSAERADQERFVTIVEEVIDEHGNTRTRSRTFPRDMSSDAIAEQMFGSPSEPVEQQGSPDGARSALIGGGSILGLVLLLLILL